MTPYVLNEDEVAQKPKSIMVNNNNNGVGGGSNNINNNGHHQNGGELNGNVKTNGDIADTPDSIPSRSSASSKSIIIVGNGKNGKAGALKRVSFGSSKGSMVETLVYDHQEDLFTDQSNLPFVSPPLVNGEDTRLHPAKVRVKFIESQSVAQVLSCPSSTSTPSSPDVTLDLSDTTMTSPSVADGYMRQISSDSGVDNPFRPDGELSREADTIVSLIKEGKPITPVKGDEMDGSLVANGHPASSQDGGKTDSAVVDGGNSPVRENAAGSNNIKSSNGSGPAANSNKKSVEPGLVEVRHTVIAPPAEAPPVEQVVIKKKPKCKCCVIQ